MSTLRFLILHTLLFFTIQLSFASPIAEELLALGEEQQKLEQEYLKLEKAQGEERLYYEDVLQRQANEIQTQLSTLARRYKGDDLQALVPYINRHITYLEQAAITTKTEISRLLDSSHLVNDAEKLKLSNQAYENMIVLDDYSLSLSDTFLLAESLNIDIEKQLADFKEALISRANLITNMLQFFNKRQADMKDKIELAPENERQHLTNHIAQLEEYNKLLVIILENNVKIMERYNIDTTKYKQLIFSITGAVTIDVLDLDVVAGLTSQWLESLNKWVVLHTPTLLMRILVFALILIISRNISRLVRRTIRHSFRKARVKLSLLMQEFFINLSGKIVFILGLLIGISQLGIDLGPLLTGFGIAGIVIGLALQDTLSNFASGMMILIYRPFDVGDFVEVSGGVRGKVSHMSLVSTTIKTVDHQRLLIPNNKIWGDIINNISGEEFRRVDMVFGIGYGDDLKKAESVLKDILESHPAVLTNDPDHEYLIKVNALGESSVDFAVRPWVRNEDYWDVYWDITREVKLRFDQEGISIPFPQRDVHIYQHSSQS